MTFTGKSVTDAILEGPRSDEVVRASAARASTASMVRTTVAGQRPLARALRCAVATVIVQRSPASFHFGRDPSFGDVFPRRREGHSQHERPKRHHNRVEPLDGVAAPDLKALVGGMIVDWHRVLQRIMEESDPARRGAFVPRPTTVSRRSAASGIGLAEPESLGHRPWLPGGRGIARREAAVPRGEPLRTTSNQCVSSEPPTSSPPPGSTSWFAVKTSTRAKTVGNRNVTLLCDAPSCRPTAASARTPC